MLRACVGLRNALKTIGYATCLPFFGPSSAAASSPCCTASSPPRGSWLPMPARRGCRKSRRRSRKAPRLSEPPIHHHRHRRRRRSSSCSSSCWQAGRRRLPDRRGAFGRGRLYRHERVGARQCAHRRSRAEEPGAGPDLAFRSGAVTGMLVAGLGLLGVAGYYAFLPPAWASAIGAAATSSTRWSRWASAPR